jgi:hypothetical protein
MDLRIDGLEGKHGNGYHPAKDGSIQDSVAGSKFKIASACQPKG